MLRFERLMQTLSSNTEEGREFVCGSHHLKARDSDALSVRPTDYRHVYSPCTTSRSVQSRRRMPKKRRLFGGGAFRHGILEVEPSFSGPVCVLAGVDVPSGPHYV